MKNSFSVFYFQECISEIFRPSVKLCFYSFEILCLSLFLYYFFGNHRNYLSFFEIQTELAKLPNLPNSDKIKNPLNTYQNLKFYSFLEYLKSVLRTF